MRHEEEKSMNRKTLIIGVVLVLAAISTTAEEPATWQEAASMTHAQVRGLMAGDKPLVTESDSAYDPKKRVIHDENDPIEYPVQLSDNQWRMRLQSDEYQIIRQAGTERPFTGALNDNKKKGVYYSRATGQPLFNSEDKFDSGTGWPSFTRPITNDAIVYIADNSLFSRRIEVVDSLSGAHLGHVFNDGPAPTRQRYCINSASLIFVPDGERPPELLLPGEM